MKFEAPEIEVTVFKVADIITTSNDSNAPTEGFDPGNGGVGNGDAM